MDMVRDDDWGDVSFKWYERIHELKWESLRNNWRWSSWGSWSSWSGNSDGFDWEWVKKNKRLFTALTISLILMIMAPIIGVPLFIYFAGKAKKSYDSFIREKIEKMQRCDNKQESE